MIITNNSRTLLQSQINSSKHGTLMTVNDVVSDKQKKLHDILYNEALEKMKEEYDSILKGNENTYIIYTEQLNENGYDKPSHVIVSIYDNIVNNINNDINNTFKNPISRYNIDLSKWWNTSYMNEYNSNITYNNIIKKAKYIESSNWSNCECIYIDYVNDKVRIRNRIDNWIKEISIKQFNSINEKEIIIPMSEKMNILNTYDSFIYQYNNL